MTSPRRKLREVTLIRAGKYSIRGAQDLLDSLDPDESVTFREVSPDYDKAVDGIVEALRFYSEEPCMTFPEIKIPESMPVSEISSHCIMMIVKTVRQPAREALAAYEKAAGK